MNQEDQTFRKLSDQRNLYLCSQTANNSYDTFDSLIVAAWTEDEARNTSPSSGTYGRALPDQVNIELIGVATARPAGIALASFNAG